MEKIGIIGCGWLGFNLGKSLINSGYSVLGTTKTESKIGLLQESGIAPYLWNLDSETALPTAFETVDIVIITIPPSQASDENHFLDQLAKLKRMLDDYQIDRRIYTSSTSVYPDINKRMAEQDASIAARTRSGISLLKAERTLLSDQLTIIRFAGLIGPGRHPGRWFAGKKNLKGGQKPVNMIHQSDCIRIIIKIIELDKWGKIFNACAPEHPSKESYYIKMTRAAGYEPPTYDKSDLESSKTIDASWLEQSLGYTDWRSIFKIDI